MKKKLTVATLAALLLFTNLSHILAQLTIPPDGGNKKASVSERIGITDITVSYNRPGVKGRDGQIWGKLIPVGYTDQEFGNTKHAPWRAGANENTSITFSTDVKIEGHDLPAGTYGFFVAYDSAECTLIFSKNSTSWGSFYYDPKEDALQVKVKPETNDKNVQWLKYEFVDQAENKATIALEWEKKVIPFTVEVDLVKTQLASFHQELRTDKGFTWESWNQAAQWCLQKNTNLDEALLWSDSATGNNFGGNHIFRAWSTKAQILDKLNRAPEAAAIMTKALPYGSEGDLHLYGRQLLAQKKNKEAFDVFKMNYDKNPGTFTTNMGMTRGYSAIGNYKKSLEFAKKAQLQAPDNANKENLNKIVKTLEEGKDIN
jgi:hypothetical protein